MDLKMGPFFGLTTGNLYKVRKTDPFLGPFSGPKNCPVFWPRFLGFSGSVGSGFGRWGGSNFGASGGPAWDAPAEARGARPQANFGTLCGRDTGVLAEPARGTFFGHMACHAQGGTHLACLSGIFYLCRSYA